MTNISAKLPSTADAVTHLRHPLHPDLHVFKRETGGWYAGFHNAGYYHRKATRTQLLPVAFDLAREWYLDQHAAFRLGLAKSPAKHSVREAAKLALRRLVASVDRKERSTAYLAGIRQILDADVLPFFGDLDVKSVGIKKWSEYETTLESRKLTRKTLHSASKRPSGLLKRGNPAGVDRTAAQPEDRQDRQSAGAISRLV